MKSEKTFKLALGGICLALTIVLLFLASFTPGVELTLYALSSIFVAIMIIETGMGGGLLLYVAALILGLILLPNKLAILPYAAIFGYYGCLKFLIEKSQSPLIQLSLKLGFFVVALCICLIFFKELFIGAINLPDINIVILIAAGAIFLLLYDFIYSLIIRFYITRIKRNGMDNFKLS